MDVIERVQQLREKKGYSIYKLARQSDLPYSSVTNMTKKGTVPTIYTLEKLCKGLDITMPQFFADDGQIYSLTENQKLMLEIFNSLDSDGQKYLLAYAKGLARFET